MRTKYIYTGDVSLNKVSHKSIQDIKEQPVENLTTFHLASYIISVIRPINYCNSKS